MSESEMSPFSVNLADVLRNKFVTGLSHGKILNRLCEEGAEKSLDYLLDLALKKEAALEDSVRVNAVSRCN